MIKSGSFNVYTNFNDIVFNDFDTFDVLKDSSGSGNFCVHHHG